MGDRRRINVKQKRVANLSMKQLSRCTRCCRKKSEQNLTRLKGDVFAFICAVRPTPAPSNPLTRASTQKAAHTEQNVRQHMVSISMALLQTTNFCTHNQLLKSNIACQPVAPAGGCLISPLCGKLSTSAVCKRTRVQSRSILNRTYSEGRCAASRVDVRERFKGKTREYMRRSM